MSDSNDKIDDDNDSSSSVKSDCLDELLENMDIDKDFECWSSFRSSIGQRASTGGASVDAEDDTPSNKSSIEVVEKNDGAVVIPSPLSPTNTVEQQDLEKWKKRLEREEVYSHRYHPDAAERKELKELETFLGMNPKRSFRTLFVRAESGGGKNIAASDRTFWNLLIHPDEQETKFPSSILLKRGPVLYGEDDQVEGEAILLTHGLVLAKAEAGTTSSSASSLASSNKKLVSRSFDHAILWRNVTFVEPVAGDDMVWSLTLQNGADSVNDGSGSDDHDDDEKNEQRLSFVCASAQQRDAWLDAMERVLIPHHVHTRNGTAADKSAVVSTDELGWQYKLVHRPAFTMAVTGMVADMVLPPAADLNKLDEYNGLAPLHYAVRLDMTTSIRRLLDAGADPNVKDADGRTCMYYAVRDELSRMTITLLEEYGAKESKLAQIEERGELFGRIQATESERNQRREDEQRQQAVEAQAKMNENMRLLNERGEKIEDLGNKASELNENAASFADMAKQLKEKSKKQSKWRPF